MKKSEDDKNKKNASYFGGHFGFLAISAQEYRRGGDYRARPDSEGLVIGREAVLRRVVFILKTVSKHSLSLSFVFLSLHTHILPNP